MTCFWWQVAHNITIHIIRLSLKKGCFDINVEKIPTFAGCRLAAHPKSRSSGSKRMFLQVLLLFVLEFSDRCTLGIAVKLKTSVCSPVSVVTKQNDPAAAAYLCVFQASLSYVHHSSGHRDLGRALSFQSPDFVHYTHRCTHCFRHQNWRVPVNWLLVLDSKAALVHKVEKQKRFI